MVTVTMIDETGIGNITLEKIQTFNAAKLSLREVIRQRVLAEVTEFNARQPKVFQGLVEPGETEILLNQSKSKQRKPLDWERQFNRAVQAFEARTFIVLADDQQLDDLDEVLELSKIKELSFLKLVPLVGG
ncbi:MAG: hypothetical protein KC422_08200 [Trueperaceae bacterium]|nr:hypothetical protein [Trueperaceae bacterium]